MWLLNALKFLDIHKDGVVFPIRKVKLKLKHWSLGHYCNGWPQYSDVEDQKTHFPSGQP